ncbi:MAG TPA: hypothetical protein VIH90_04345 [Candidatus Saccharimonadales bacterium]
MATRFIIDCADHVGFIRLVNGQKKVLTRANKSSELQDDYSRSKIGDLLELVDNESGKRVLVQVVDVEVFSSLSDLYNNSNIAEETFDKKFTNEAQLRDEYEKNRPGYTQIIDQNGLVAWHIKLIS